MSSADRFARPLGVDLLALAYMLAPLGNILFSIHALGVDHWYSPSVIWQFLPTISLQDRIWLASIFVAGIFLLQRRKSAWMFAAVLVVFALLFKFYHGLVSGYTNSVTIISFFSGLLTALVVFYFRYPYLERRESFWKLLSSSKRFNIGIPAKAKDQNAVLKNVSLTGAFLDLPAKESHAFQKGESIPCEFGEALQLNAIVMRITETGIGIQFSELTSEQKEALKQLVEPQASS